MTQFGDSEWKRRAERRRIIRDEVRARFASDLGATATTAVDSITFAPAQQRRKIVSLLKVTRDGEIGGAQADALVVMARALMTSGLGLGGPMANVGQSIISPHLNVSQDLLQYFTTECDLRHRTDQS